jgi:hypothetical protein
MSLLVFSFITKFQVLQWKQAVAYQSWDIHNKISSGEYDRKSK